MRSNKKLSPEAHYLPAEPSEHYRRIVALQNEIDQITGAKPRSGWSFEILARYGRLRERLARPVRLAPWLALPLLLSAFLASDRNPPIPMGSAIVVRDTMSSDAQRHAAVREAAIKWGLSVDTALAISHAENTGGRSDAWSRTGCCLGIMQVNVRYWYGAFHSECGGSDLFDVRTNACYGVLIWRHHLRECEGDGECALRAYVGQHRNWASGDFYVQDIGRYLAAP